MTPLTILAKAFNSYQLRQIEKALKTLFEGLEVQVEVVGANEFKWVQIALAGEDEAIAKNLIQKEIGLCPVTLDNLSDFANVKGFIQSIEGADGLAVDIGVFNPKRILAEIPLTNLLKQLVVGKQVTLKEWCNIWAISENTPIQVKITTVSAEKNRLSAELSDRQIERYHTWRDSLLDRLLVLGCSLEDLKTAVNRAGLGRDIINVETIGVLEHALVCKLGTDAAGIISRLGRVLWKAKFSVFNPKRLPSE